MRLRRARQQLWVHFLLHMEEAFARMPSWAVSRSDEGQPQPMSTASSRTVTPPLGSPASQVAGTAQATVVSTPAPAESYSHEPEQIDFGSAESYEELQNTLSSHGMTDFVQRSTTAKRAEFVRDASALRHRLKKRRGFINPRRRHVQYWDLTTALALLYTTTVTPYEVGAGLKTEIGPLYVVNSVINLIFMLDIVLQFVLPVIDEQVGDNATLVRDHGRLAKRYLRSWFAVDVFTVLPFDTVTLISPSLFGSDCGSGGSGALVKGIKLIRVMRLFKLLRMLRASRILQRWDSSISVSSTTRTMVTAWLSWAVCMHWLACLWMLLPQLQSSWRENGGVALAMEAQMTHDPTCTGCVCSSDPNSAVCRSPCLTDCEIAVAANISGLPEMNVRNGQSWYCRAVGKGWLLPDFRDSPMTMYIFGLSKVFGGLGPLGASDTSESIIIVVTNLGVRISFAILQGLIMRVLTTGNPEETRFRQRLDALNAMMRDQHIPDVVKRKVRDYFRRSKQLAKRMSYFGLIDSTVSKKLKSDLRILMSRNTFDTVWWLALCEVQFLEELSQCIKREAFAIDEPIPNADPDGILRLYVLVTGVACRAGAILTTGASWGDIMLSVPRLRDTRPAKALTFCELVVLDRDSLVKLMAHYPTSAQQIRQAALKLAMRRMFILIAMFTKLQENSSQPQGIAARAHVTEIHVTPRSAIEAKALGAASGARAPQVSPGGKPRVAPLSPSAALRALQSHGAVHSLSTWREPHHHRSTPGGVDDPQASSCIKRSRLRARTNSASSPSPARTPRTPPESPKDVPKGRADADGDAGGMVLASAVMTRLDRVERTMQQMLRKMVERDAREAAVHAAWLASPLGATASSDGGNPLAA